MLKLSTIVRWNYKSDGILQTVLEAFLVYPLPCASKVEYPHSHPTHPTPPTPHTQGKQQVAVGLDNKMVIKHLIDGKQQDVSWCWSSNTQLNRCNIPVNTSIYVQCVYYRSVSHGPNKINNSTELVHHDRSSVIQLSLLLWTLSSKQPCNTCFTSC